MTEDEVREVCLALPNTTETFPFSPDLPVFKAANNKIFAILSAPGAPSPSVSLKADPDDVTALVATYASIGPGYHLSKKHWITVVLDGDVPPDLLEQLIGDSYRLVRPKPPRAPHVLRD